MLQGFCGLAQEQQDFRMELPYIFSHLRSHPDVGRRKKPTPKNSFFKQKDRLIEFSTVVKTPKKPTHPILIISLTNLA